MASPLENQPVGDQTLLNQQPTDSAMSTLANSLNSPENNAISPSLQSGEQSLLASGTTTLNTSDGMDALYGNSSQPSEMSVLQTIANNDSQALQWGETNNNASVISGAESNDAAVLSFLSQYGQSGDSSTAQTPYSALTSSQSGDSSVAAQTPAYTGSNLSAMMGSGEIPIDNGNGLTGQVAVDYNPNVSALNPSDVPSTSGQAAAAVYLQQLADYTMGSGLSAGVGTGMDAQTPAAQALQDLINANPNNPNAVGQFAQLTEQQIAQTYAAAENIGTGAEVNGGTHTNPIDGDNPGAGEDLGTAAANLEAQGVAVTPQNLASEYLQVTEQDSQMTDGLGVV